MYKFEGADESTGVIRVADGLYIAWHPDRGENIDWDGYLDWRDAGNAAVSQYSQAELEQKADDDEAIVLGRDLTKQVAALFQMQLAVFEVLQDKGVMTANEVDAKAPGIKALAQKWKQKLTRLRQLGRL